MIYCVEDEGSIRDLMLYTLNMTELSRCSLVNT